MRPQAQWADPSEPLDNPRHEAFAVALAETGNECEAYRRTYPRSRGWKQASVQRAAIRLTATVLPRVEALREASRTARMLSRADALEICATFARDAKLPARDRLAAIERAARLEGWEKANLHVTGGLPELLRSLPPV